MSATPPAQGSSALPQHHSGQDLKELCSESYQLLTYNGMKLDKLRDENNSQGPWTITFGVHSSMSQAIKEATSKKPGWKKQTAHKKLIPWFLLSAKFRTTHWHVHRTISKIHPKIGGILYQTINFTLLFHFDNANSSKTQISGISKMHIVRRQTSSQRNCFKTLLRSDLTQRRWHLQLCKGRLKMRQHFMRLP